MGHLGQDMDIFGDIFSDQAADQAGWTDKKNKDKGAGDQPDNTERDNNTDTWAYSNKEQPKWTEISSDSLRWGNTDPDKDSDNDTNKSTDTDKDSDPDKDWDNDTNKSTDTDKDSDPDKDWDNDLKEWETDEVLENLVKDLEDNIDKVDGWDVDAKKVLQDTLSDLQKANMRIKELEEEWKTYQDKYFEKFWENSELNLMKPLVETVQEDPELFLLVKSYKNSDWDAKVNSLVKMLEKETGKDVSGYLTDNGKWAMASATSTGSDSWMSQWGRPSFTPDAKQPWQTDELF